MRLLVTGGAGYIGSVVAAQLIGQGHEVVVLDDLSTGHADAVPAGATFVRGSITSEAEEILAAGVDAVLHFAARSLVGESVAEPARYWQANLGGTLALLDAMRETGTGRIVFSSTAAVYGEPDRVPIDESAPPRPTSPYGASKVAVDTVLATYAGLHGFAGVSLRYFNVAGAHRTEDGRWLGERHDPETHLIPNILAIAASPHGPATTVRIFGDDYPTPDGSCVRDYIHVSDLARAHLLALDACTPGHAPPGGSGSGGVVRPGHAPPGGSGEVVPPGHAPPGGSGGVVPPGHAPPGGSGGVVPPGQHRVYNLGNGDGYSNLEVLTACREVTGRDIPARTVGRRAGDPAVLVASSARIRADLGWSPDRDLRSMIADAWAFTQAAGR